MARRDGRGDLLHRRSIADVADLPLGPDLAGDLTQALLTPREEHAVPSASGERAGSRGADAARPAGDDRDGQLATDSDGVRRRGGPAGRVRDDDAQLVL